MRRHVPIGIVLIAFLAVSTAQGQAPNLVLGKTSTEWIETARTHKEVKFRRAALIALEVFGPGSAGVLPALIEVLEKDEEPQVRREAAMVLGRAGDKAKGAVHALGDAMTRDKSDSVREAAAQALAGKLNPFADEQVRALADALKDAHQGTRAAAAEALMKLGAKAIPAYDAIFALAKDEAKDRFSRQYALKVLSRLGSDKAEVADLLAGILRDGKAAPQLREEAIDGLGRLTGVAIDKVIPPLAELLDKKIPVELRRAAAAALAKQAKDAKSAWPAIKSALNDSDQAVRYQLIRLCGQLGKELDEPAGEAALAVINAALKDGNVEIRLAAVQELADLPSPDSRVNEVLDELSSNDPIAAIRDAAEAAHKKRTGRPLR